MAAGVPAWETLQNFVTTHGDTYPALAPTTGPSLAGKSVLITGASKGIGRTTAVRYALAGCNKIAVAARSPLDGVIAEIKAANPSAAVLPLQVDIKSEESVAAAAAEVKKAWDGKLDILIANAGTVEENWVPILQSDTKDWWNVWETNVKGTYLTVKHFLPLVLESPTKIMIVVSSIGAFILPPTASGYELGKMALCGLVQYAMIENGDSGLCAYAMGPGGVMTDMGKAIPTEFQWILTDKVELPADMMVWLGRERREWLAGRYVDAKWDVVELEKRKAEIVEKDLLKFRAAV